MPEPYSVPPWFAQQQLPLPTPTPTTAVYNPQTGTYAQGSQNIANRLPALAGQPVPEGTTTHNTSTPQTGGTQPTIDQVIAIMRTFPPTNDGFRAGVAAVKQRYPGAAFDLIEHPTRLDKVNLGGGVYDILGAATGSSGTWVGSAQPEAFIAPPGGGSNRTSAGSPTSPVAPSGSNPVGGGDYESIFDQIIGNRPPNLASLRQMEPALRQAGMSLVYNAAGDGADVRMPNGEIVDVIRGMSGPSGGEAWQFMRPSQAMGGTGGGGGGMPAPAGGLAGSPTSTGPIMGGNWEAGIDPSYGFRFGEGVKALQRSAAARGTLLSGGTLRNLMNYGQNAASQEYQNVFNRNQNLATLGLNATNNAANLGSSYGSQIGNLSGTYSGQLGNQSSNFGNQLSNLANNQAGSSLGLTQGQINGLTNLFGQQGNVNAAGTVGANNSWAGTLANLANIFGPAVIRNPTG